MITDATLLLDSSKQLTSAGVSFSSDVLDLSMIRDLGEGNQLQLLITVTETFVSTNVAPNNGVVQFGIALSNSSNMGSPAYLLTSGLYTADVLKAKIGNDPATQILIPIAGLISPLNATIGADGSRYMSAVYTVVNTFTAGKVRTEIILNPQTVNGRKYYSKSYTIV